MPELCEVCLTAQFLSSLIGSSITKIKVLNGRYLKKDIKGFDILKFPLKIDDVSSKGKFMWFTLSNGDNTYYMLTTFGLTGKWYFSPLSTESDDEETCNIKFITKKGTKEQNVCFSDMRNFGTIEFTDDVKVLNKKLNKLERDLLQNPPTLNEFKESFKALKNKKKKIVVVLMAQNVKEGIGSGLGNYLVPEILYRSKISPHRTIESLTDDDLKTLYRSIKYILKLCYLTNSTQYISHLKKFLKTHTNDVDSGKFPNYLESTNIGNNTFDFNVYRRKKDADGNEVIGEKIISGRTTYWVPSVQV